MTTRPSRSARNLLQLSHQWVELPVDIQLEVAGKIAVKVFHKMSRPKKILVALCVVMGLVAILTLSIVTLSKIDADTLVFGAWMFLLGALLILAVTKLTDR